MGVRSHTVNIRLKLKWAAFRRRLNAEQAFRRRIAAYSYEAVLVSVLVHLLLAIFAGSSVLWDIIGKESVVFRGEKIERPVLEERIASLPVKLQELQRAKKPPKLVSRVESADRRRLAMPVMPLPEVGLKLADKNAEPVRVSSHSDMPGRLDMGVSGVNFFGVRSKGEKIIFILDASKQMMEDAKGGYNTYRYAKDKIHQMVDKMPPATLFNVLVYNDSNVDMFRGQLVPASQANRDALKQWLEPINSDPYNVGQVSRKYSSSVQYDSLTGSGARFWLRAVQAAMEQTADTIFVLCGGFGRYSAPGPRGERGEPDPKEMAEYREKLAALNEKAQKAFAAENAARSKRGLPPKIVYNWNNYMTQELRLTLPPYPAVPGGGGGGGPQMTPEEVVLDHLDAVWATQYTARELAAPRLNFVYLIARDAATQREYDDIQSLKHIANDFRGEFEFLRGEKTMKNLL